MSLFQLGEFTLHSGQKSDFKIDCDFLSESDLECIATLIAQRIPMGFMSVLGVPKGGLRLQKALEPYCNTRSGYILLVDDVFTTGTSLNEVRLTIPLPYRTIGAVIFARTQPPLWIMPLFKLYEREAWR